MPTKSQLRKRRSAQSTASTTEAEPAEEEAREANNLLTRIKPILFPVLKVSSCVVLGLTTAASCSRLRIAVLLFVGTLLTIFVALIRTTMSIIRENDQTPVYMPDIHNPDDTVTPQQQLTVFQHDDKVLKYFCREFPALALATTWFYLWSQTKPIFPIYTLFILFRLFYHPLFRIHLWKEPPSKQLGRPFGAVPLFDPASRVKTINGNAQFQRELSTNSGLVIVDCSATWCAPCQSIAPYVEELAQHFTSHKFLSIDVDISRDVAKDLLIASVPSFIIFKNGQRMEMLKAPTPEKLRDTIQSYT